jgi:flagellar motor switch/type III secretory pathway protein FliN
MVVRRYDKLAVSFCLVLAMGASWVGPLFAQEVKKLDQPAKTEAPAATKEAAKPEPTKTEATTKKDEPPKTEAPKATEAPLPPIPPEVQAKLVAARKAVAELIVAAQDAGLVETSIDPPPILDILITGRATDLRTVKNTTAKKPYPVSPEVFGAWFTGYSKKDVEGINYDQDIRIINPSAGLKQWYDSRAQILEQYIQEIRKAKGPAPKKDEAKPAETKKADTPAKPAEPKKG